ncbi:hypothetical protein HMPREF1575_01441, partial [Gardnerella vaginalis JCP7672]
MFAVARFLVWYCASSLFGVVGGLGVSMLACYSALFFTWYCAKFEYFSPR